MGLEKNLCQILNLHLIMMKFIKKGKNKKKIERTKPENGPTIEGWPTLKPAVRLSIYPPFESPFPFSYSSLSVTFPFPFAETERREFLFPFLFIAIFFLQI